MKYTSLLVLILLLSCAPKSPQKEQPLQHPLSTWNDSNLKAKIISFVVSVSDQYSEHYVAPEDRIAVFDNDGTLWTEKPLYIPVELEFDYIKKNYASKPDWQKDSFFKAIANNDYSVLKDYETPKLISKVFGAHAGQKEEDYKKFVYNTLSTKQHEKFNRPLKELTFVPMVELVHYLQEHEFKVFIVTGGEISSVRTISEEIYNIPKENVVGSNMDYQYVSSSKGTYIQRKASIHSVNDGPIKPVNIELHIGRKPIFAAGNSDGDYQMMEYTLSGKGPAMAILVNHDDAEREYSYMSGTEKAIADAPEKGWFVVSMKHDFKQIFSNPYKQNQ